LPSSFSLENGLPLASMSVNGPPKLEAVAVSSACGGWTVTRWISSYAATPTIASTPISHISSRSCLSFDLGGVSSVTDQCILITRG